MDNELHSVHFYVIRFHVPRPQWVNSWNPYQHKKAHVNESGVARKTSKLKSREMHVLLELVFQCIVASTWLLLMVWRLVGVRASAIMMLIPGVFVGSVCIRNVCKFVVVSLLFGCCRRCCWRHARPVFYQYIFSGGMLGLAIYGIFH